MQSNKKFMTCILPALFCLLSVALAACGSSGGSAQPSNGTGSTKAPDAQQVYVYPYSGATQIRDLDPALTTDEGVVRVMQMLYTGLVEVDDKLNVVPQMASSWQQSADGLKWTFKLKPNLKFSDGTTITSQDVVYSIDRALKPSLKASGADTFLALIKDAHLRYTGKVPTLINDSLLAPDPQTVVIITSQKAAYFLDTITAPEAFVVEKKMIDKYGDAGFVNHLDEGGSSGPWIISKQDQGKDVIFTPNPYYYGPHPQLKKLVYAFYQQADTVYKAYQTNQVDESAVPTTQLDAARALPNGQLHQIPQLWIGWVTMNYLTKPFDNIKIRQAFALAINKDSITHNIYRDKYQPTNHIVPQGQPGYNPDLTGPDGTTSTKGNPTKAKELFQEGLKEEGMTLATMPQIVYTISTSGSADSRNSAAALQQMWQNTLGVTVKINDEDYTKFLSDSGNTVGNPKGLMLFTGGWVADYPDPQDWLTLQYDKGPGDTVNYGQNNSTDAATQLATQKLLEQADANPDPVARMKQYYKAEQQMVNDVAVAPLFQVTAFTVRKPCMVGLVNNPQGIVPSDGWANVYVSTASPCADTTQYQ